MAGSLKNYRNVVERGDDLDPPAIKRIKRRRRLRVQDIDEIDEILRMDAENKRTKGEANDKSREVEAVCVTG